MDGNSTHNETTEKENFKSTKFWGCNPLSLFKSANMIPTSNESLEEQLNTSTRLCFVIFIIMLILLPTKYSLIFIAIVLVIVNIIYFTMNKRMKTNVENFVSFGKKEFIKPLENRARIEYHIDTHKLIPKTYSGKIQRGEQDCYQFKKRPESALFCNDFKEMKFDGSMVSKNQKLVGSAHPRTKTAPIVVSPAYDLSYWKNDEMVTIPWINTATNVDRFQSGQDISTCCGNINNEFVSPRLSDAFVRSNNNLIPIEEGEVIEEQENFCMSCDGSNGKLQNRPSEIKYGDFIEVPQAFKKAKPTDPDYPLSYEVSGLVNLQSGYNPEQLKSSLPSNFPAGNCLQSEELATYNDSIFTQTIQPGVYTRSQIIEPINSNIGISFNQQFPPVTCSTTKNGGLMFTEHDPYTVTIDKPNNSMDVNNAVTYDTVYDPRMSGYGTSYRSYTEDVTGQTRFAYDDVNSIRMPNYITRNNIDFESYSDSYGPMKDAGGNEYNSKIRALAQDSWLRNSLQFRNDIQNRAMRKANAIAWQKKLAPIRTSTSAGQMNRCK